MELGAGPDHSGDPEVIVSGPTKPKAVKSFVRPDGMVEKYGLLVPATSPAISVELMCYRDAGTEREVKGNLGAEEHFRRAWKLMWPEYEWSEWVDLLVQAWCNYKWIMVIGHQRASKSYTIAFALYLDYCADPVNTLTSMGTVTFDGLKIRMWSDLQRAAETAAVKFPFTYRSTTNELRVYPSEVQGDAAQKYQIHGMACNNSKDAPGRIRGGHAPRRRLVIDEAENVADPIYEAMINPMSAPDAKCALLCNPMEKVSKFGQWCEPREGWGSVTPASLMWECKAERSVCIHLDGLQSPNVRLGKAKWTGLLTSENVKETLDRFGENSLQWWSLIRGWFPPDGLVARIWPSNTIALASRNIVFEFQPLKCATLDPAFEFDACVLHLGDMGPVKRGDKFWAINGTASHTIKFKVGDEYEPKDYQVAHQVMEICQANGVKPQHFIMDTTGNGRGVYAILQKEWSRDVQSVNYGGKATERNLRADDDRKCEDIYKYFVTELWFRASEFAREGLLAGLNNLHENTASDLNSRRYTLVQGTNGVLMVAESKDEVKKRLGRSPDWGDPFVQFGELLERLGTRPGMLDTAPKQSGKWAKARELAIEAAKVYEDEHAYSAPLEIV